MKKFFLYLIFLLLLSSTSNAFFGKLKLICTTTERLESIREGYKPHSRTFEVIETRGNLVINGDLKYPIVKNNSVQIKGERKITKKMKKAELTTFQSSYKIMKNSLLFEFFTIQAGENSYSFMEKGKCKKL